MAERIETLTVPGLSADGEYYPDANPSRQSVPIVFDDKVLIVRPVGVSPVVDGKVDVKGEIQRRVKAFSLYKKYLPDYTQDNEFVVLEGNFNQDSDLSNPSGNVEMNPVLGRMMDRYDNVVCIIDMSEEEIVNNPELCKSLAKINISYIWMLLSEGVIPDRGLPGNFLGDHKKLGDFQKRVARSLTDSNIMVGYDKDNNQKVFCDPDWINYLEDYNGTNFPRARSLLKYGIRVAFFGSMAYLNRNKS